MAFSGIILIGVGCLYLVRRVAPDIRSEFSVEGILPTIGKENTVLAIDRYRFSEDVARYVRALSAENPALAKAWSDNPLGEFGFKDGKPYRQPNSPALKLARETVEYFVLNRLSLHLSGHFDNNKEIDEQELSTLGRKDIPSVLLENRFLELFSRPMDEREAFVGHPASSKVLEGMGSSAKIVAAFGSGGVIFDRFQLILPRGTKVTRLNPQKVRIQTKRFAMEIGVGFAGYKSNFPRDFEQFYLAKKFNEVESYAVNLDFAVRFTWRSLLTHRGWEYFRWVDSFLERLEEEFSFGRFVERIGWETAVTASKIMENRSRLGRGSDEGSKAPTHVH